jgi:hypothetical protein
VFGSMLGFLAAISGRGNDTSDPISSSETYWHPDQTNKPTN